MTSIGKTLAMIAASGILLGACGGSDPQAASPSASDPSAAGTKASCGGAGHTDDKSHCSAKDADGGASQ